jgi:hypothetical protein
LNSNTLSGPIPESFSSLTALGLLYATFNQLNGTIPASLGSLTALS